MSRRFQRGMVLLLMSFLVAILTLMAGTSLRLAALKGRSSDGFRNHVQALHAAEIALAHCEEIVDERMSSVHASSPSKPATIDADSTGLTPIDHVIAAASWQDSHRWEKYSADLIEVDLPHGTTAKPAECVIDELHSPHRFVTTARGFSPNYSRAHHDFGGAEVWVQSVTVAYATSPSSASSAPSGSPVESAGPPPHSWRQLVSPPH